MRILLLDDEKSIRDSYACMLESLGHEVTVCADPGRCILPCSASNRCAENTPCRDVIISDIYMPVQSGIDFIKQLRSHGCLIRHIALISGAWSGRDLAEAGRLECMIFEKPFRMEALAAWLSECSERM